MNADSMTFRDAGNCTAMGRNGRMKVSGVADGRGRPFHGGRLMSRAADPGKNGAGRSRKT